MHRKIPVVLLATALRLIAQQPGSTAQQPADSTQLTQQILERLNTLEKQNRELLEEVHTLRKEVDANKAVAATNSGTAAPQNSAEQPPLDERVAVQERRTAEQAQTKVEAAHKLPIQLTGMVLFNAFSNTENYSTPSVNNYGLLSGPSSSGATLRQSLLGFNFQGPSLPGDGHINGSIMMDFYGGYADPEQTRVRLRQAYISMDWANRSFTVGQQKPLISPTQPDSLAEVGIPPLAGAGNLWLWLPQARYEERTHFGSNNGLTSQIAVLQTDEAYVNIPAQFASSLEQARPALEGRFAFWHKFDETRKFEIAPGFHVSSTHVAGTSVGSHIGSLDWLVVPENWLHFSGAFYKGQNVASLGALGNGFVVLANGDVRPVDSTGGWAQLSIPINSRFTFNVFGGLENDHSPFLSATSIVHNWNYASNVMYHLGPNVVVSLEAMQLRTRSFAGSSGVQNHYDLAIGYLF
jgi:hypothetical protein